jgi:membrane-bound ClpP family serine protease
MTLALLLDPTLVYVLLMVGLWVAVTAFYIPGTGFPEILALILLSVALYGLTHQPTRWIGVALLIGGMVWMAVLPLMSPRFYVFGEAALGVQALGSFFLYRGTMPNIYVIVIVLFVAFVYNRLLLLPVLKDLRNGSAATEAELLMGAEGRVVRGLQPPHSGTAHIQGELWTIRSPEALETDDRVQVIAVKGLELEVSIVKRKHEYAG